jgi:hypothetical protein
MNTMKTETLQHSHPPTPPPNFHSDLHSGLQQIAEYVADRNHSYDESQHRSSAYATPGSAMPELTHHASQQSFQGSLGDGGGDPGLGVQYVSSTIIVFDANTDNFQGRIRERHCSIPGKSVQRNSCKRESTV